MSDLPEYLDGLPNISGLQDEALSMLTERVGKGVENIDVGKVVESWFIQGIAASRKVQEVVAAAASGILDRESDVEEEADKE